MNITTTIADESLREAVTNQLTWDPEFDASMVGVTAHDGVVALTGYVLTYAAKLAAERAARRVYGVKAVANDVHVKLACERLDSDIATDAVTALHARDGVPQNIAVTVRDGHITLSGTVDWYFQKLAAERAVRYLRAPAGCLMTSSSSHQSRRWMCRSRSSRRCTDTPTSMPAASMWRLKAEKWP